MSDEPKRNSLRIPTIHLNGTSAESLTEALEKAYSAIGEAKRALQETAPNGRDYYVQTQDRQGDAIQQASTEHYARLEKLESVRKELVEIVEGIQKQVDDRNRQKVAVYTRQEFENDRFGEAGKPE